MPTPDEVLALFNSGDPWALGAVPSQIDERDYEFSPQADGAPRSVPSTIVCKGTGVTPIYNQQGGTCTGYSAAAILSMHHFVETGKRVSYDGSELHHRVVKSYEAGAMPRDVLEDIRTRGAETQETALTSVLTTIAGYAWIDSHNPDAVMAALVGGPLHIAVWLNQEMMDAYYAKSKAYVGATSDGQGYHAMVVVGGDREKGVTLQNSWGEWGGFGIGTAKGGFVNVGWDYLVKHCGELWSVADASNSTLDGYIKTHEQFDTGSGLRLVKRPDRPAVYVVVGKGRWWVQSQQALDVMGLRGQPIKQLDPNDEVWSYPVIGKDAPEGLRA